VFVSISKIQKIKEKTNMLNKWLSVLHTRLAKIEAAPADSGRGACMLPDPNGGPPICEQLDQTTCKNLGGTFVGGDC
jgi:hypothetical protein